jgi:SNF2 family DNA or RNA helicase
MSAPDPEFTEVEQSASERAGTSAGKKKRVAKKKTTRTSSKSSTPTSAPESVHKRELVVPTLTELLAQPPDSLQMVELARAAWQLRLAQNFDELMCLAKLRTISHLDYQIETALRVLRVLKGRALLADEVGLGKTIEACMLIKECLLRRMAQRVLVLVPSALVGQWVEELRSKFQIHAYGPVERDAAKDASAGAWTQTGVHVVSIHQAKLERNAVDLKAVGWDLVVVDEAHHIKNRNTAGWRLINTLESRYLLLLTATPVETDLEELYNLVTLLKPGQLSTPAEFKRKFVVGGDPLAPKNRDALRALLGEVMIRNTRARAGLTIALPPRLAQTLVITPSAGEARVYAEVLRLVRQHASAPGNVRLVLRSWMEAAGASLFALAGLLMQDHLSRPITVQDAASELTPIVASALREPSRKVQQVVHLIQKTNDKVLIFARHRATLEALASAFKAAKISHVTFHGALSGREKDQAVADFAEHAQCMVASEVGGEGRNLQFANVLINVDLPWNPMKIEQRIGRLHRIGQTKEVRVYSLCAAQSAEEKILEVLDRRIHLFELVVGEMDMVLGRALGDLEFDDKIFDIYSQSPDDSQVVAQFEQLAEKLAQGRASYERIKKLDEALFAEDFEA